jgi:riboflavin kinase / FMN adenylyltransferase
LRLGRAIKGGLAYLIDLGADLGFVVGVVEPILLGGVRVSSSRVRDLLERGRVEEAMALLGRYHFVSGRVVGGHRRGRELGFPTANISPRTEALPLDGIYATLLTLGENQWLSVSSIGVNPTFGDGSRTVESFMFDFTGDIYGEVVKLSFVKRIRDEQRFASIEQLVAQMREDVETAKSIFAHLNLCQQPLGHR